MSRKAADVEAIRTLDDFEVQGRTVLVRADFNCPIEKGTRRIKDDTRIRASAPTIRELAEKGARVVVLSHQGDPLDYQNFTSLAEHAERLSTALGKRVIFIDDVCGPAARERIRQLGEGEVLLLENVRYHTEETIIFEKQVALSPEEQAETPVVRKLSPLAQLYVCDAFACVHRSEPTLVGFPEVLPSAAGRLFAAELATLERVRENPEKPCVFMLGGAKILDAFAMMKTVLASGSADEILATGLVGQVFLLAEGIELGEASMRVIREMKLAEFVPAAKELLAGHGKKIRRPVDVAVDRDGAREEVRVKELPADGPIMDVGTRTVKEYADVLAKARTIFLNGPAGAYEREEFSEGTRRLWEAVARSDGFSLIGGGDTIAAAKRFGVAEEMSAISTAGGGLILYLSGEKLPVLEALEKSGRREGAGKA
ncbi:MAG: phosphoglycerate kinase [Planctomycetota bacterium]